MPYRPGIDSVNVETLPYVTDEIANDFLNKYLRDQVDIAGYVPWVEPEYDPSMPEDPAANARLQEYLRSTPGHLQRREQLRLKYADKLRGV